MFLQPGASADVVIPAAQRVIIGANRAAIASITIPLGLPGGPCDTVVGTSKTYGPFPSGATVNIEAVAGSIEYVVGASPALTDIQLNPASVAITGGTITGTAVTVTNLLAAVNTNISGTPGNGTSSGTRGRAAFAAAASTVTITSTLCTATSSVFVQLGGSDATLTSVRVTPGAGSFVVTGNAAATAATVFNFLLVN